jgi:hypothetical protein
LVVSFPVVASIVVVADAVLRTRVELPDNCCIVVVTLDVLAIDVGLVIYHSFDFRGIGLVAVGLLALVPPV